MLEILQQELQIGQWRKQGRGGRAARRRIERVLGKLEKKFRRCEIPVEFDNETCTDFGLFAKLEQFKEIIGIRQLLERVVTLRKRHNSKWSAVEMFDYLLDGLMLGLSRFEHLEKLRFDPGYRKVKEVEEIPGEKRYRDLMGMAGEETLYELTDVNEHLLCGQSAWEKDRQVWIDYDDSVLTLNGRQEGGQIGYNPTRKGRPSLKMRVAQINEWRSVLWMELEGGSVSLNTEFLTTHSVCVAGLERLGLVLEGVRADRGAYDEKNCEAFEAQSTQYLIKARMTQHLRNCIVKHIKDNEWTAVSSHYDVASMQYKPVTWKAPRRFVIVRERIEKESNQACLPLEEFYRYQAIVTSDNESGGEAVWHNYNKRCTVENQIEELKNGFACGQNSQHEFIRNKAFMLTKMIAYNMFNWFRRSALPDDMSGARIETVRRKVINIAGNITGKARKRRIHLAANPWLQRVEAVITERLWRFFDWVQIQWSPLRC